MNSAWTILKEHIVNFYLIRRLSLFELKAENRNHYLGFLWEIINPGIQIAIYWFVFGYGIRSNRSVDGIPFFTWMLAGIVVWFFVNQATLLGSKSVYTRIRMVSKLNFPISVIPSYVIASKFYPHLALLGIVVILFQFTGYPVSIYMLQLPYFIVALLLLLVSFSLITSTLAAVVRDVHMMVNSLMKILLYLTPILWSPKHLGFIHELMKLNPLYYIVEGYRASLLGTSWYFVDHPLYTAYFWAVVVVLFLIGSNLHVKFRDNFVDYL
jgi:teichoic acid transport system permease protein